MRTLIAATVAAVLLAGAARADEPTKFYLEDGKVTAREHADLKAEVAALRKELAARKPCTCSGECCGAKPTAAPVTLPNPTARPRGLWPDGTVVERHADGVWREVPGAPKQAPPATRASYSAPATCSGPGCSLPSYAPSYLPGYALPAAPQSCPNGRCPTPR